MDIQNQLTPISQKQPQLIQSTNSSLKKKIMCKFFIMGNCIRGDNCCYLHSEEEKNKMISKPSIECPMYNLGCCKNGPMCKYQHIKNETIDLNENSLLSDYPELPIWYLEHYFDKPIEIIFSEIERQNIQEVKELKEKYGINKKKQYSNYQYDVYAEKKDNIINSLNQNIHYYLLRCVNHLSIQFSMEHNVIEIPNIFIHKFLEKSNKIDIILIILDIENMNYSGFVLFKKKIESNEELSNLMRLNYHEEVRESNDYIKIEWLWRTKLHYTKLLHMINPFNNSQGCCEEISTEIGFYSCRMMIKRLSKDEVKDLVKQKKKQETQESSSKQNYLIHHKFPIIDDISSSSHHFQQIVHSQDDEKNVYVTNINNLQVNINNSTMHDYDNSYYHRKRERSQSNSKYNQRTQYHRNSLYNKHYYSNESSKFYHKERRPQATFNNYNNRNSTKGNEMKKNNSYKNKLFSNAMDKINTNSNKRR